MLEPKILILTGNLSGQVSGGMGVAATEITKQLAAIMPIQLVKSGEEILPEIKQVYTVNGSSPTKQLVSYSLFPSEPITISEYDFLISPYRTDSFYKEKKISTEASILEVVETGVPSYLEEVALYNQKIIELAQTLSFDIIYCHDWITFQAGISLKLLTGKKLVLHVHSLETDRKPENKNPNIYYLERKAMDYSDAVISVSEYTKELIRKNYEIYPGKVHVVYNALSKTTISKTERDNATLNVLFMGRLTHQKGIENFIRIAEIVYLDFQNVQFIIAGEGELKTDIEETIENSSAAECISLLGFLDSEEKNNLLSVTDIFCMPSESEPFGLSALEAAGAGIPCVISKQSGIAEILSSALKVDFKDVPGFAMSILSLLESDSLRKTIADGQLSEIKGLSWENTAGKIKDIFRTI